nr:PREDICTED: activator of 90 kDa heat shock protein ATPase homolog 2 isoform X4 [Bos mutus]
MGMILPTKAMAAQELTVERKLSENTLQIQASSRVALGVRIPTVALHMTELFDTAIEQLYRIFTVKDLTNKKIVMKWRCRNWPEESILKMQIFSSEVSAWPRIKPINLSCHSSREHWTN